MTKFCKDCRYFVPEERSTFTASGQRSYAAAVHDEASPYIALLPTRQAACVAQQREAEPCLVTGRPQFVTSSPYELRDDDNLCGVAGRWWEPKT